MPKTMPMRGPSFRVSSEIVRYPGRRVANSKRILLAKFLLICFISRAVGSAQHVAEGGAWAAVAIVTRDRRDSLLATLARLDALPEHPPVVVVDNGSRDGTVAAVRHTFPSVDAVALGCNAGAAGRTIAVRRTLAPY